MQCLTEAAWYIGGFERTILGVHSLGRLEASNRVADAAPSWESSSLPSGGRR